MFVPAKGFRLLRCVWLCGMHRMHNKTRAIMVLHAKLQMRMQTLCENAVMLCAFQFKMQKPFGFVPFVAANVQIVH